MGGSSNLRARPHFRRRGGIPAAAAACWGTIRRSVGEREGEQAVADVGEHVAACSHHHELFRIFPQAVGDGDGIGGEGNALLPDFLAGLRVEGSEVLVGGGTDLYVQKYAQLIDQNVDLISNTPNLCCIEIENGVCTLGAGITATDLLESDNFQSAFPRLKDHLKLVASWDSPVSVYGFIRDLDSGTVIILSLHKYILI